VAKNATKLKILKSKKEREVTVICVSRPKSASFSPLSDFSRRGAAEASKQARTNGIFWQRRTLNFLGDRTNYKAKDIIGKTINLFCIYLFQIDKFINMYLHINNFFCSTYQLPNKTGNLLFAMHLGTYLHNLWCQDNYRRKKRYFSSP
jgi:hypothetical protein